MHLFNQSSGHNYCNNHYNAVFLHLHARRNCPFESCGKTVVLKLESVCLSKCDLNLYFIQDMNHINLDRSPLAT